MEQKRTKSPTAFTHGDTFGKPVCDFCLQAADSKYVDWTEEIVNKHPILERWVGLLLELRVAACAYNASSRNFIFANLAKKSFQQPRNFATATWDLPCN